MDPVDVYKLVGAKVGGVLERLMDELVPEVRPHVEIMPDIQALPTEDDRRGAATVVSGRIVATIVISSVLAQLRGHGCPEEVLEEVVAEAREHEQQNAQAASS